MSTVSSVQSGISSPVKPKAPEPQAESPAPAAPAETAPAPAAPQTDSTQIAGAASKAQFKATQAMQVGNAGEPVAETPVEPVVETPVEPPPVPDGSKVNGNSGTTDRGIIEGLYTSVLDRNPADPFFDPAYEDGNAGPLFWENSGKNVQQLTHDFFNSEEFKAKNLSNEQIVDKLYSGILNRAPDEGGRQNWIDHLNKGMSVDEAIDHFFASPEYGAQAGGGVLPAADHVVQPAPPPPAAETAPVTDAAPVAEEVPLGAEVPAAEPTADAPAETPGVVTTTAGDGRINVFVIDDFHTGADGFNHGTAIRDTIQNGGLLGPQHPEIGVTNLHIGEDAVSEGVNATAVQAGNPNINDRADRISAALDEVLRRLQSGEQIDAINLSQYLPANFEEAATSDIRAKIDQIENQFGIPVSVAAGNNGPFSSTNVLATPDTLLVANTENGAIDPQSGIGNVFVNGSSPFLANTTSAATANLTPLVGQWRDWGYTFAEIRQIIAGQLAVPTGPKTIAA